MVNSETDQNYLMEVIDLSDNDHINALLSLMNDYMFDDMGLKSQLPSVLGEKIIEGLKRQNNYTGFLLKSKDKYVALANCFIGFSTFKAKQLINIHDFVVTPDFRKKGAGKSLLEFIKSYSKEKDFCKVTLEVRDDNYKAQRLYKNTGFEDCKPPMYFWENIIY